LERPLEGKRVLLYAGRAPAAAPATGIGKIHDAEQSGLVKAALQSVARAGDTRVTRRLTEENTKPVRAASGAGKH
jgi:hypothetical protein